MNRIVKPIYVDLGVFSNQCIGHAILKKEKGVLILEEVQISGMTLVKRKEKSRGRR